MTYNRHEQTVTVMLHRASITLSLLALAVAGPVVAIAQPAEQTVSSTVAPSLDTSLLDEVNASRRSMALAPLDTHLGLAGVASAHARDMAEKGYVGYADTAGVPLLDQVRIAERQSLIGSFASNIAVLPASATPAQIHAALLSDPGNAENLTRGFTHAGMGTYEAGGRLYVVQLFARIDGSLNQPLPLKLAGSTLLQPALVNSGMTPVGWSLVSADGNLVARGGGKRVQSSSGQPLEGYLNVDVAVGTDIYSLRGPYVQVD